MPRHKWSSVKAEHCIGLHKTRKAKTTALSIAHLADITTTVAASTTMMTNTSDDRIDTTLELSFTSGDAPIRSAMMHLLQCPSQKDDQKSVHVHYNANVLGSANYGQLPSVVLTKKLFQELRGCPMVEFSLSLRAEERSNLIHYVNASTTVMPMSKHFNVCIGDSLKGHATLQKVDLVVDYCSCWGNIIRSLASCPQLTQVTIQFAIELGPAQFLYSGHPIYELVTTSTSLSRLVLKDFPFMDFSFEMLIAAVSYNKRMTELSISSCHSTWDQATTPTIIDAVTKLTVVNQSLQVLELPVDLAHCLPILESLELNRSLQKFRLLKRPRELPDGVTEFLAKLKNTKSKSPINREQDPQKEQEKAQSSSEEDDDDDDTPRLSGSPAANQKKFRLLKQPGIVAWFLARLPTTNINKTKKIADYDDSGSIVGVPTRITFCLHHSQVSFMAREERIQKGSINAIINHHEDVTFVYHLLVTNPSLLLL